MHAAGPEPCVSQRVRQKLIVGGLAVVIVQAGVPLTGVGVGHPVRRIQRGAGNCLKGHCRRLGHVQIPGQVRIQFGHLFPGVVQRIVLHDVALVVCRLGALGLFLFSRDSPAALLPGRSVSVLVEVAIVGMLVHGDLVQVFVGLGLVRVEV